MIASTAASQAPPDDAPPNEAHVEFCGEDYTVRTSRPFRVGREGDLTVDDNP